MTVDDKRAELISHLFPAGLPKLWCPAITHLKSDGSLDEKRTDRHMQRVSDFVPAWVFFGRTGNGEQLDDEFIAHALPAINRLAKKHECMVFISAIAEQLEDSVERIAIVKDWVRDVDSPIHGIMVAAPTVPEGREETNDQCETILRQLLEFEIPTGVCQSLVNGSSRIAPIVIERLATEFSNLIFIEDSTGEDRLAHAGISIANIARFRGIDGEFVRWCSAMGGPYHGFISPAVNCFGMQLCESIEFLEESYAMHAVNVITPVQRVCEEVHRAITTIPAQNRHANAAKVIDHFMAFGRDAESPLLIDGSEVAPDIMRRVKTALDENGFLRVHGYIESP